MKYLVPTAIILLALVGIFWYGPEEQVQEQVQVQEQAQVQIQEPVQEQLGARKTAMTPSSRAIVDEGTHWNIDLPTRGNQKANTIRVEKNRSKVHMDRWGGEKTLSIDFGFVTPGNKNTEDNVIEFTSPMADVVIYSLDASEFGALEYEVVLKQRPPQNSFTFTFEGYEDFIFAYQPPELTELELAIEPGATRPDNVKGSYAVYGKGKDGHVVGETDYATGKAFHIYRPKLIDDVGNETWATLSFDDQTGEMTITADSAWLDAATYPVIIDPTMGYTTIGGTLNNGNQRIRCTAASTTASGQQVNSFTVYGANDVGDGAIGAIYEGLTTWRASSTSAGDNLSLAWWQTDLTTPYAITASTVYYVCGHFDVINPGGFNDYYYDLVSGKDGASNDTSRYPAWASSLTINNGVQYSVYATYDAIPASGSTYLPINNGGTVINNGGLVID